MDSKIDSRFDFTMYALTLSLHMFRRHRVASAWASFGAALPACQIYHTGSWHIRNRPALLGFTWSLPSGRVPGCNGVHYATSQVAIQGGDGCGWIRPLHLGMTLVPNEEGQDGCDG